MNKILETLDLKQLTTQLVQYLPRVAMALAVFVGFVVIYRIVRRPLSKVLEQAGLHDRLIELLVGSVVRYTFMVIGLVMALDQLGVNVGAALAGLGVAGIAVGFAAQDSVANVIAGILIFLDKPFQVGDWIRTEGEYGKVANITLRTTRIRTTRNTFVVIPNKSIIDAVLENYSKHGELRVDVPLGIAYKEDIGQARDVLLEAVGKLDWIKKDPGPDVVVEELGGSSVNLRVRVWIDEAEDERKTLFTVLEKSKQALDAADIEIPFPHLQLFVDDVRQPVWERLAALPGGGGTAAS